MYDEISNHKAGWACETNQESIKQSLIQMLEDKNRYSVYSNNARKLALEYDWSVLANRLHDILQVIVQRYC